MTIEWNHENAAHLLRRAGFGGTPRQVERAVKRGLDKTLARLMRPLGKPPALLAGIEKLPQLQTWWLTRMATSRSPLTHKLTVFWHNHFATAISKVKQVERMHAHVATLERHALGNFRELLGAMATDPAMLVWLDNRKNSKQKPNENFARELMELFTTGVVDLHGEANYTEADVQDVARAFTGWSLNDGGFVFKSNKHDYGVKTVKGVTGELDGGDVLDLLANDDATARRVASKLFTYFAYPVPLDDPVVDELSALYTATEGEMRPLVEAILRHEAFYSEHAKQGRIKSPAEFLVGSLVLLRARIRRGKKDDMPRQLGQRIKSLGQSLYDPPDVFGWQEGTAWVETSGMLARLRVADWLSEQDGKDGPLRYKPVRLLGPKQAWKSMVGRDVARVALASLGVTAPEPSTLDALATYVEHDGPVVVNGAFAKGRFRRVLGLAMAGAEYQRA